MLGGGSCALASDSKDPVVVAVDPVGVMRIPPPLAVATDPEAEETAMTPEDAVKRRMHIGATLRELSEGSGDVALPGMKAYVHYTVTLVGDGTVMDDTRNSGFGDRRYGSTRHSCWGGTVS